MRKKKWITNTLQNLRIDNEEVKKNMQGPIPEKGSIVAFVIL